MTLSPGAIPRERVRPISETETQITFIADQGLMAKIERLRELLAHKNPEGSYAKTISQISEVALVELDPERKPLRTAPPAAREDSAAVPRALREFVWQRASGTCEFVDPGSDRRCHSRWALQVDHVKPYGLGGKTTADNLRLVCRSHNQWLAIQSFGTQKISEFVPTLKS